MAYTKKPYPVVQITGGVDVSKDPLFLVDLNSPDLLNVRHDRGLLRKDLGWAAFGSTLPLDSSIMHLGILRLANGVLYNVVVTLTSVYTMLGTTYVADPGVLLTGTIDDNISYVQTIDSTGADLYVFTNGQDAVLKWTGSGGIQTLGGLAGITGRQLGAFRNRLLLADTFEGGQRMPTRLRYSVVGDPEDFSGTGSGIADLVDTPGGITRLIPWRHRYLIIKTDSIWELVYVGGDKVFDYVPLHTSIGSSSPLACIAANDVIVILGDSIYTYDGSTFDDIGQPIFHYLYPVETRLVAADRMLRATGIYVPQLKEYWVSVPLSETSSRLFKYNFITKGWVQKDETSKYRYGLYEFSSREPWSDWVGQWNSSSGPWLEETNKSGTPTVVRGDDDGNVWMDTRSTTNTDEMIFTTKDWLFGHNSRIVELRIQSRGGPFTVFTSTDKGVTWIQQKTLPATTNFYEHLVELNMTVQTLRVKIVSPATSLDVEWIEPWYIPRQKTKIY